MVNSQNDNSYSGFVPDAFEQLNNNFSDVSLLHERELHCLYRAKRFGRWYLLKTLRPEYRQNATYSQMLRKELEILMRLQHPNIVGCLGMEYVDACPVGCEEPVGDCIVMEYVDGQTLKDWINEAK